jgi:hypothetical protein
MWHRLRTLILERLRFKESWVIFFILGLIMMNYPFIVVFNKDQSLFDMPFLYLYYVVGWLISIGVILLFTKASRMTDKDEGRSRRP